jgi:hypothetical protein
MNRRYALAAVLVAAALACSEAPYDPGTGGTPQGFSIAYGIWAPMPSDNCTAAIHDRYSVVGPDRKVYPTWHPPTDPSTGCSFGHDHGRDPRGSDLYRLVGDIPFGYANEQLEAFDPSNPRREDHVGHKVEWENDVLMHFGSSAADALFEVRCDVLTKLHQGTHSKDALTNNVHELVYHLRCTDGSEMHITLLSAIGEPGAFERTCDGATVVVGPPVPANSPQGDGVRRIPDRTCVDQEILVPAGQESDFDELHESWETDNDIRAANGRRLAFFNPYYQVVFPSRYHDPGSAALIGRPIDLCYEVTATGERAAGGPCETSTANGTIAGVTFDDPRSEFDGVRRFVDINYNIIENERGPTTWYTDPYGRDARTEPFPGSIRQWIAEMDNRRGDLVLQGPTLGRTRNYGGPGVHAPN